MRRMSISERARAAGSRCHAQPEAARRTARQLARTPAQAEGVALPRQPLAHFEPSCDHQGPMVGLSDRCPFPIRAAGGNFQVARHSFASPPRPAPESMVSSTFQASRFEFTIVKKCDPPRRLKNRIVNNSVESDRSARQGDIQIRIVQHQHHHIVQLGATHP